jgi:hypothetical protein
VIVRQPRRFKAAGLFRVGIMSFTQLTTSLPVSVQGKGNGYAFAVIDYGEEHNLIWVVALDDSGEIWCSPNPKVRMRNNWTMGRTIAANRETGTNGG